MTKSPCKGEHLAKAAAQFIGTRFLLHGRDPRLGLDCVGLVIASLRSIGVKARSPEGYSLRNVAPSPWLPYASFAGLSSVNDDIETGDVVLLAINEWQQHLVVAESQTSGIHAHAGLRRVVRQPMDFNASQIAHWRLI